MKKTILFSLLIFVGCKNQPSIITVAPGITERAPIDEHGVRHSCDTAEMMRSLKECIKNGDIGAIVNKDKTPFNPCEVISLNGTAYLRDEHEWSKILQP